MERDFLRKTDTIKDNCSKIIEENRRTTKETLQSCNNEVEKLKIERNAYYEKFKDLSDNLIQYKKDVDMKAMAKIGNGYRGIITGFQMEQARTKESERKLSSLKRPSSPYKTREYIKALETTSSTCDSLDDIENVQPPQQKARQKRSYSVTTRFQPKNTNTRR